MTYLGNALARLIPQLVIKAKNTIRDLDSVERDKGIEELRVSQHYQVVRYEEDK